MVTIADAKIDGIQLYLCEKSHLGKQYTILGLGDGMKIELAADRNEVAQMTERVLSMATEDHTGVCDVFLNNID